jgi:ATP-dependent Clp protease adapter protein ClpS
MTAMAQKDQEKTRKSPALALMDHWNKTNPEEVIASVLRNHPQLTRRQAVEALKEAGYF